VADAPGKPRKMLKIKRIAGLGEAKNDSKLITAAGHDESTHEQTTQGAFKLAINLPKVDFVKTAAGSNQPKPEESKVSETQLDSKLKSVEVKKLKTKIKPTIVECKPSITKIQSPKKAGETPKFVFSFKSGPAEVISLVSGPNLLANLENEKNKPINYNLFDRNKDQPVNFNFMIKPNTNKPKQNKQATDQKQENLIEKNPLDS
jgi:hypothetical protein